MGVEGSEAATEVAGETADKAGTLRGEVVLFADIFLNVKELVAAGLVAVDEFPSAGADGAVHVYGGPSVAPDVGVVPDELAVSRGISSAPQQGDETAAVDGLWNVIGMNTSHFQDGGKEVLDEEVTVTALLGLDDAWPADNHGFSDAALME